MLVLCGQVRIIVFPRHRRIHLNLTEFLKILPPITDFFITFLLLPRKRICNKRSKAPRYNLIMTGEQIINVSTPILAVIFGALCVIECHGRWNKGDFTSTLYLAGYKTHGLLPGCINQEEQAGWLSSESVPRKHEEKRKCINLIFEPSPQTLRADNAAPEKPQRQPQKVRCICWEVGLVQGRSAFPTVFLGPSGGRTNLRSWGLGKEICFLYFRL